MIDNSALVLVLPDDSVDAVLQKVKDTGAATVELLVPEGTRAMQSLGGLTRLKQALDADGIRALIISSDEKTLNAARMVTLDAVAVEGAQVTIPPGTPGAQPVRNPRATIRLPETEPPPPAGTRPADNDADFLRQLSQGMPARDEYDPFAELDEMSAAMVGTAATRRGEGPTLIDTAGPAAAEDWDAAFGVSAPGEVPRRRVRADEIELSDDDLARASGRRSRPGQRPAARPARTDRTTAEVEARRNQRFWLLLPVLLLLALVVVIAVWQLFFAGRVTVAISPPRVAAETRQFTDFVLPLTSEDPGENATSVWAVPVSVPAEFTVAGQVLVDTPAPGSSARGVAVVWNTLQQPFDLPPNTEFVAVKADGQEVRFILDTPLQVPPARFEQQGFGQSVILNGRAEVSLTARSSGSASNVDANTLTRIEIPGQPALTVNVSGSPLNIEHGPIGGGSETLVRIVTEADVERVLGEALTGLYAAGIQALRSQIDESQFGIEESFVSPSRETLAARQGYELIVNPGVNQQVDPNNPGFTVTVRTPAFAGLASPRGRPIVQQLATVTPLALATSGERVGGTTVKNFRWDGQRLLVDVEMTTRASTEVDPAVPGQIRAALASLPRDQARAALEDFKARGLIGGYELPDADMPEASKITVVIR